MVGRRRTIVVDARYQLRVAGVAAALMLASALVFTGVVHIETLRLHEIVSGYDADIARALHDEGLLDLILMAALGVGLTLGVLLLALVETSRVAGPVHSLRRALARLQGGDYTTPVRVRQGDRLVALADSVDQLREALAKGTVEDTEFLESLADRVEAAKDEDEVAAIGAELRDLAALKRAHLGR
jgi:hypothetical protein